MAPRYQTRRSQRKLARNSRRNFFITLVLIIFLLYAALMWILPTFINGLGLVKNYTTPKKEKITEASENSSLAPPILNIPFEATKTAEINIKGYGTPNSKVILFVDDEQKDTTDVSSDGSFEFKNVALSLGTNNIYGKSLDEEEKMSLPSKTIKIYYDDEEPTLTINEPEDGKTIQGGDKKIKIAGQTEENAQVFINDTQIIVNKDGNFSTELPLNEGENNFSIKAVDKAQNSKEDSRKVIYTP